MRQLGQLGRQQALLERLGEPAGVALGLLGAHARVALGLEQLRELDRRAPPLGDVADEAREQRRLAGPDPRDGQLERELLAVRAQAGELHPAVEDRALAGLEIAPERRAVRLAQARRDDQRRQLGADRVLARMTERLHRRRVEVDDQAATVHRDHAVEARVDDRRLRAPRTAAAGPRRGGARRTGRPGGRPSASARAGRGRARGPAARRTPSRRARRRGRTPAGRRRRAARSAGRPRRAGSSGRA